MHSNKSSASLNPNSCRQNSTSRSSEINNPMRRSFGANPFAKPSIVTNSRGLYPITPANSPSGTDYPQSASLTRESLTSLRDFEDKENGKDQNLKQSRLKSPTVVKGTKNFMSPTISAASKVNASPRKKILTERNDPVRISGNDFPETVDVNSKPECEPIQAKTEASSDSTVTSVKNSSGPVNEATSKGSSDSTVTSVKNSSGPVNEATSASKGSKKKVAFDTKVETIPLKEPECVDVDEDVKAVASPSVKSPCASTASTLLAPLDADPLMPPYDPKTNFLSPRPQFLHYKPSPRIKRYLDEEGDGNPLEESFNLDGFSDTDFTDETQSDSSQKESSDDVSQDKLVKDVQTETIEEVPLSEVIPPVADETESDSSQKESSDDVSQDKLVKDVQSETVEEVPVSEVIPPVAEMEKAKVEPRNPSKQHFFTKTKCFALILLMVLAGLWMSGSNSALRNISAINDSASFSELLEKYETLEVVKENLEGLAQHLWHRYDRFYSYISELMHKLRGGTAFGPLLYYNLTDMHEGLLLDNSIEEISWKTSVMMGDYKEKLDEEPLHGLDGYEAGFEVMDDQGVEEGFEVEDRQEGTSEDVLIEANNPENEAEETDVMAVEDEISVVAEPELLPEQVLPPEEVASVPMEMEDCTVATPEVAEPELLPVQEPKHEDASISMETEGHLTMVETMDAIAPQPATTRNSVPLMIGVSFVVVALVASALFTLKKRRGFTKSSPAVVDRSNLAKKFNISPQHDGLPERWSYPTEVDVVGESYPSEMSSFQNTSSRGKVVNENEAQSYERKQTRKTRRESTASSDLSLGSASYGSFTYEMISAKHRNGEEEVVVTPIRRSSRLRKQVISP